MCNILVNIQIDSAFVHSGRVVLFLREKCFLKAQFIIWAFHTWCLTKGLSVVFRHNFFICLQNKRVRMIFNFRPLTVSFSLWVTQFYLEFVRFFFFTAMYGNGMLLKSQWGILYNEISFFQRPKLEICPVPGQICRKSDEYFGQFIESRNRLLLLCCVMFIRINHCALSKGWSLMGSVTVPAMYPRGMESNGTFFCCLFFFS